MASRGNRFSFGGSASMRESLGMPLRREVGGGSGKPMDQWGAAAGQKGGGKKKQKQASRRQTYVTRPSSSVQQRPSIATSSRISASGRTSAGR